MALPTLTTENLRLIPHKSQHKTTIIHSYIEEQKGYTDNYAAEGLAVSTSWNLQTTTPERKGPALVKDSEFGFDTPILKPRVNRVDKSSFQENPSTVTFANKLDDSSSQNTYPSKGKKVERPFRENVKSHAKNQEKKAKSDEEHKMRMLVTIVSCLLFSFIQKVSQNGEKGSVKSERLLNQLLFTKAII